MPLLGKSVKHSELLKISKFIVALFLASTILKVFLDNTLGGIVDELLINKVGNKFIISFYIAVYGRVV